MLRATSPSSRRRPVTLEQAADGSVVVEETPTPPAHRVDPRVALAVAGSVLVLAVLAPELRPFLRRLVR